MKDYINVKLKKNNETEIGEKVEDINFVGIVGKKKAHIKPKGLDKLLNYLKLKAKSAFLIATINMIKKYCIDFVEILLNQTLKNILSNINDFLPAENNAFEDSFLFCTLKNVFFEFVPQNEQSLSEKGENILKKISKKLSLEIKEIHQKKLKEFAKDCSEKIGLEIEKAQYNVINQNLGMKLNIKKYSFFQNEGKNDLENLLKDKSIKYANINYAKKICEKSAVKFKNLFKESIEEIVENEASRICKKAIRMLRAEGIKVGLFRPVTLWPFPKKEIAEAAKKVKKILTVEMSMGQMVQDVQINAGKYCDVDFLGRPGGMLPEVEKIVQRVKSYV